MEYTIKVNVVKNKENIKGFASIVFGDSMKITNVAILEKKDKSGLYLAMPRYKTNEKDEQNRNTYKDVCHPITAEFREELYQNILETYEQTRQGKQPEAKTDGKMPEFTVKVTPYERPGSNIRGFARIYLEDSFVINNVNLLQGKEKIFVAMPSFKTKQTDEQGKAIYQDVCYPVTKEFRQRLYDEIQQVYEHERQKKREKVQEQTRQGKQKINEEREAIRK